MEDLLGSDLTGHFRAPALLEVNLLVLNTLLDIRDLDDLILVEKLSGARPADEGINKLFRMDILDALAYMGDCWGNCWKYFIIFQHHGISRKTKNT